MERGSKLVRPIAAIAALAATVALGTACSKEGPRFKFDDLGGGSPYIFVYPGVTDSSADKRDNGYYRTGIERGVVCHIVGRTVVSHPEDGERAESSSDWYKLAGIPVQYATGTYGDLVPEGAAIEEC